MKNKFFQTLLALACAAPLAIAQPPQSQTVPPAQSQNPQYPGQAQPGYPPGTIQEQQPQQLPQQQQQLPQEQTPMAPQATSPASAAGQIQDALQKQSPTLASKVNVTVAPDSSIQLSGTVDTQQQKDQAEQIARTAAPNQQVTNDLKVSMSTPATVPPTSATEGSKAAEATGEAEQQQQAATGQNPNLPQSGAPPSANATSADLQSRIQSALQKEPEVGNANINVNVTDTTIELTGTVPSKSAERAAKRVAQANANGRKVVNHLQIGAGTSAPPL